ncbi:MAG: hypothetical protein ACXWL2_02520 [Candidatus Chromulinivorax sp.]
MEVNVTLCIAMLQFGCAYYFLRTYLFVPACKILDEQQAFQKSLYDNLKCEQDNKEMLLMQYRANNKISKAELQKAIPSITCIEEQKFVYNDQIFDLNSSKDVIESDRKKTEHFLVEHFIQVIKK